MLLSWGVIMKMDIKRDKKFININRKMKINNIKHVHSDSPIKFYDVVNAYPYNNFLVKTKTGYNLATK